MKEILSNHKVRTSSDTVNDEMRKLCAHNSERLLKGPPTPPALFTKVDKSLHSNQDPRNIEEEEDTIENVKSNRSGE